MADELNKKQDPRLFTRRVPPPAFSFASDKDFFEAWFARWEAFLADSGIDSLQVADNVEATQAAKTAALKKIKFGALFAAFDSDTARMIEAMAIEDKKDADQIIDALRERTTGSTNVRVYRKMLYERKRQPEESAEQFLEEMRRLCTRCKFERPASKEDYENERLAEAVIMNVNDPEIQEHLLRLKGTATPAEITEMVKTMLSARKGVRQLAGEAAEAARFDSSRATGSQRGGSPRRGRGTNGRGGTPCANCGRHHEKGACPARGKTCFKCQQTGHFKQYCKKADQVERAAAIDAEDREGAAATSMVRGATPGRVWSCQSYAQVVRMPPGVRQPEPLPPLKGTTVQVRPKNRDNTQDVKFLADTGANLTGIPPEMLPRMGIAKQDLPRMAKVNPPRQADGKPGALRPVGIFRAQLTWGNKSLWADVYVMQGLDRPLLSRQHARDLGIARVVTDDDLPK